MLYPEWNSLGSDRGLSGANLVERSITAGCCVRRASCSHDAAETRRPLTKDQQRDLTICVFHGLIRASRPAHQQLFRHETKIDAEHNFGLIILRCVNARNFAKDLARTPTQKQARWFCFLTSSP